MASPTVNNGVCACQSKGVFLQRLGGKRDHPRLDARKGLRLGNTVWQLKI
jgi:hypothetical protein